MKLICVICDQFDASPLTSIPPGWTDIVPDPTSLPPTTKIPTKPGTVHDTWGTCPACTEFHRTAFRVPETPPLDESADQSLLF